MERIYPEHEASGIHGISPACALAELVWLPKDQKSYKIFLERMKVQEQRFGTAGVNYRKIQ